MNEHEIERIAAAFHVLRPDWPAASLRTMITKRAGNMPRRDVCVMLAWVACDSASSTPARMFESGPWKRAAAVEGASTPRDVAARERCSVCGKDRDHALHANDHDFERLGPAEVPASPEVDHLRGLLRRATATEVTGGEAL